MTRNEESLELLKVDRVGRVRITRERREALLGEYDRRGMTRPQFAQWAGIKYQTLAWWLRRRESRSNPKPGAVSWVEAEIEAGSEGGLAIELPGGARMKVSREEQIGMAAKILKELGRC